MSIVAVVLTGCEKELGFDEGGENLNVIAISMVASPDTTLEAIVARTYRTGVVGTECSGDVSEGRHAAVCHGDIFGQRRLSGRDGLRCRALPFPQRLSTEDRRCDCGFSH